MRLIDADELVKYFRDKYEPTDVIYFPYVLDDIDKQPTVDAVEVVRCKDCKYRAGNIYENPELLKSEVDK